jgi:hypothetical protein
MKKRYSTLETAIEMAELHALDHKPGDQMRAYWQTVTQELKAMRKGGK